MFNIASYGDFLETNIIRWILEKKISKNHILSTCLLKAKVDDSINQHVLAKVCVGASQH